MDDDRKTTWVIGDIHGMYDPLRTLLQHLDDEWLDKFVFLGDYIDHGPSSKEVLDYIMGLGDKAVTLMGNHEHLLLETLFSEKFQEQWGNRIWEENGSERTVNSFGYNSIDEFRDNVDSKYTDFLKDHLQCFHVETIADEDTKFNFLLTHAGVMPDVSLADQLAANSYAGHNQLMEERRIWIENSFVWIREDFFKGDPDHWQDHVVIHGHTPTHIMGGILSDFDADEDLEQKTDIYVRKHPENEEKTVSINIDTSAAFGNRLTALGLSTRNLGFGWLDIEVLQMDVKTGYYRNDYPFTHSKIRVYTGEELGIKTLF